MSFSGKATYSAGAGLPEIADDVADVVSLVSPHETPLLDALGDGARPAQSTCHEWLEDALLPNTDTINDSTYSNPASDTTFTVTDAARYRVGDQLRVEGAGEIMLVTAVNVGGGAITVVRGYGGTTPATLASGLVLNILGNAALEGDSADAARFTARSRKSNYTQIFSATVEVSGSELAVRQLGLRDEMNHQKQQRLRELLRDLENCVINGRAPAATPEGSTTVRRTMKGLLAFISTNRFAPGSAGFPSDAALTEEQLNLALRSVWKGSAGHIDTIVVNGREKRSINLFISAAQRYYDPRDHAVSPMVGVYESDFGVCRVVLSRYVPVGTVMLLDSSRIGVLPLAGRSFHYKALGATGDRDWGQVLGEYTLELRNENAHGVISGFTA